MAGNKTNIRFQTSGTEKVKRDYADIRKANSALSASSKRSGKAFENSARATGAMTAKSQALASQSAVTSQQIGGMNASLMGTARIMATGFLVAGIVGIARTSDRYNVLQDRIRTATAELGNYAEVSNSLYGIAQRTGSALETNVVLFQRLQVGAEALGASTADMLTFVETVQQLGVIGGSSTEAMRAGTLQLSQAMSEGIVRAQEFNSVLENMPEVAQAIGRGLNMSVSEMRALMKDGELLSKDVLQALINQAPEVAEAFAKIPDRFERNLVKAANAFSKSMAEFDAGVGLTSGMTYQLGLLAENMDMIIGVAAPLIGAVGAVAVANFLGTRSTLAFTAAKTALLPAIGAVSGASQLEAAQVTKAEVLKAAAIYRTAQAYQAGAIAQLNAARSSKASTATMTAMTHRLVAANELLVTSKAQAIAAERAHQVAMGRTAIAARATAAAMGVMRGAMALVGGPVGVALLAIGGAVAYISNQQQNAEEHNDRYIAALHELGVEAEGVAEKIEKVTAAKKQQAAIVLAEDIEAERDIRQTLNRQMSSVLGAFNSIRTVAEVKEALAKIQSGEITATDIEGNTARAQQLQLLIDRYVEATDKLETFYDLQAKRSAMAHAAIPAANDNDTSDNGAAKAAGISDALIAKMDRELELAGMLDDQRRISIAQQKAEEDVRKKLSKAGVTNIEILDAEIARVRDHASATTQQIILLHTQAEAKKKAARETEAAQKKQDKAKQSVEEFIAGLGDEIKALALNDQQRFIHNKMLEAENIARRGGIALTEEQIKRIQEESAALFQVTEMKKAREKAAEDEARAIQQVYERAGENIQRAWGDLWFDIFDKGKISAKDFFSTLKSGFARMFADLLTLSASKSLLGPLAEGMEGAFGLSAQDIKKLGFGGGSATQQGLDIVNSVGSAREDSKKAFAGPNTTVLVNTQGQPIETNSLLDAGKKKGFNFGAKGVEKQLNKIWGKFSQGTQNLLKGFGQIAGGAMMGMAVGSLTGSSTGGAIGGALGSMFGPLGSLVGGLLGGFVGGLFKKTPKTAGVISVGNDGVISGSGLFKRGKADIGVAEGMVGTVVNTLNDIAEVLGAELRSGFTIGQIGQYKDEFVFQETPSAKQKKFGKKSEGGQRFATAEEALAAAIQSAIDRGIIEGLSTLDEQLLKSARSIEEGIELVVEGRKFRRELEITFMGLTDPLGAALAALEDDFEDQRKAAEKFGADIVKLEKVQADERLRVIEQYNEQQLSGLNNLLTSLTSGSASPLAPVDQLALAQQRFLDIRARALSGDEKAKGQLDSAAQDFLRASQLVFASSQEYYTRYNLVISTLQQLTGTNLDIPTQFLNETGLISPTDLITNLNENIGAANDNINSTMSSSFADIGTLIFSAGDTARLQMDTLIDEVRALREDLGGSPLSNAPITKPFTGGTQNIGNNYMTYIPPINNWKFGT